jgi:hypothetical protein
MNSSFDLITADDPKWSRYLEQTEHDFFHTAEYHRLWERFGHGRALLAVYGTDNKFVAWPYLLNTIEPETNSVSWTDVTSVYGYPGPVCHGCSDGEELPHSAWARLTEFWRSQGVVSAFTRLHPILGNSRFILDRQIDRTEAGPGVVREGQTVAIGLEENEETIWNNYHSDVRKSVRKAERIGLETVIDPEWRYLGDFLALYYATMQRNCASPFYFFSREYFEGLRRALGDHGTLIASRYQGHTVAMCLTFDWRGIANYHLSAGELDLQHCSPAKVLIHEAQKWARRRGNRVLNLGGGRGSNADSLFCFKAAFSPLRYWYSTGRWVLNQTRYNELTRLHREQAQKSGTELHGRFFPSYRAPFVAGSGPVTTRFVTAAASS